LLQADLAGRASGATDADRAAVAARVKAILADLPAGEREIPTRTATRIQEAIRETLGTDDPFRPVKERHLSRFPETARWAEGVVAGSPDPWSAAVWMSGFGNIMDSGIIEQDAMEREVGAGPGGILEYRIPRGFRERLLSANRVGFLLDNAGEAAFDLPLLSRLAARGSSLWLGVKGDAVIDDLTLAEAQRMGLSSFGELVSNGNRGVGTDLALCGEGFRRRLSGSDLVLSKGQANFETLVRRLPNAYFLLRCKCPVVSRAVGRPEGELLLLDRCGGIAA
jgi:uncharacterized protein with ATP-grasp and redox domains